MIITHQALTSKTGLLQEKQKYPYYDYSPPPTMENQRYRLLCYDIPIHTDKTMTANKPDILLHDLQEKSAFLIDVIHPADHK